MRHDLGRGALGTFLAGGVGVSVLAHASFAYADMGFSPGFLRGAVGFDQALFVGMSIVAFVSAALGLFGLWRMSRSRSRVSTPPASPGEALDD